MNDQLETILKTVFVITENIVNEQGHFQSNVAVSLNKEDAVLAVQKFKQQHERLVKINNHLDTRYSNIISEIITDCNTKSIKSKPLSEREFKNKIADALFNMAVNRGADLDDLEKLGFYKDENGNVYERSYLDGDSYFSYEEVKVI